MGWTCLLIICVGVSADRRRTMREGEANRKMRPAGLSDGNRTRGEAGKAEAGMKVLGCLRAQRGNCVRKKKSESKRGADGPGRERQRKGGEAATLPPHPRLLPLCPLGCVGNPMLW